MAYDQLDSRARKRGIVTLPFDRANGCGLVQILIFCEGNKKVHITSATYVALFDTRKTRGIKQEILQAREVIAGILCFVHEDSLTHSRFRLCHLRKLIYAFVYFVLPLIRSRDVHFRYARTPHVRNHRGSERGTNGAHVWSIYTFPVLRMCTSSR